jgi:predicted helicase
MDEEPLFRQQWSYEPQGNERVNVFLTNTLEDLEHTAEQLGPLRALSDEANSAYEVKKHKPVLVVLGNPPYSNFGQQNRNPWILGLLDDYKRGLNEKKLNLNDDFIKFVRWAQWRVAKTGSGIVGYITNNVYLDGLTHRRMRECLLEAFDEIYIVNLHGSAKKQEKAPDGSKDDNVFDIMVGVAIVLFVKLPPSTNKSSNKLLATVRYVDLWGRRAGKYEWLDDHHTDNTKWQKLLPEAPNYYFVPRDLSGQKEYEKWWSLTDVFPVSNNGLKTDRDDLFFDFEKKTLEIRMRTFFHSELPSYFADQYRIHDSSSYDIEARRKELSFNPNAIRKCLYRPFDFRWLYYDVGLTSRPAEKVMRHLLAGDNLGLCCLRQSRREETGAYLAVNCLVNKDAVSLFDIGTVFPLYLFSNGNLPEEDLFAHENGRRPNLSAEFIKEFCEKLQVEFVPNGLGRPGKREVGPETIFHYAYAVFHSPAYRERYAEFLRADFPRLPLTGNLELFRTLAGYGGELVDLHARGKGEPHGISFPVKGDNVIEEVRYQPPQAKEPGRVWINDRQYVVGVPETAWTFPIGGYLPAQRWLKDRIGRTLGYEEQAEYQRIIWALIETRRLMGEIDASINQHGGWPMK